MSRPRAGRAWLCAGLLLALAACREGFFDPTPGGTGTPGPPTAELIAENLRMVAGEANAIRIGFSPRDPSVRVRVARSSGEGRVIACALGSIDDPLPPARECLPDLPDGVRETLTRTGLGAVALVREGDPVTVGIRLEFAEQSRRIALAFPLLEPPPGASVCKDNGCNPFFEVRPVRDGRFTATATWTGGDATLVMVEGRVLARALTSTGIPYRPVDEAKGAGPLRIEGSLDAPSEFALAFLNVAGADLTRIRIDTTWP